MTWAGPVAEISSPRTPRTGSRLWRLALCALVALGCSSAYSQSPAAAASAMQRPGHPLRQTVSGEFWTEPATLRSLGFEWRITGDDNRNAAVQVSYRRKGEQAWHKALPLFRLQNESVVGGLPRDGGWPALQSLRGAQYVRRQHSQSRAGYRVRSPPGALRSRRSDGRQSPNRHRPHPHASRARRRRPRLPRLSLRLQRRRDSSPPSPACWPPTTWAQISPTTRAKCRRECSLATPSWCMPVSTRTTASSTAALTAALPPTARRSTAPTT